MIRCMRGQWFVICFRIASPVLLLCPNGSACMTILTASQSYWENMDRKISTEQQRPKMQSYPRQSSYSGEREQHITTMLVSIRNLQSQVYLIQCKWFSSVPACLPACSRHPLQVLAENKRAGEMVQQVKALATKSDEWSFMSRTQMMEGETQLPKVIVSLPQESSAAHKHTNTNN